MIHASTSSDWGVNHGRHIPGKDDCLIDRFRTQVTADDMACATGKVTIGEASVDAALPFSSMFAGLLIAADLVRAQMPGYPQVPNFAFLDWYGALDTLQAWNRKPQGGCICAQQGRVSTKLSMPARSIFLYSKKGKVSSVVVGHLKRWCSRAPITEITTT